MNTAPRTSAPARFYAQDYRRRLRDAGAFRELTPSAHVVLAALCDRANAAGLAWPATDTIARDYGLGMSTVRRALGELVTAGLLIILRRAGRVNRYHLTLPAAIGIEHPVDKTERPPARITRVPRPETTPDHGQEHAIEKNNQHADSAEVAVKEDKSDEEPAGPPPANDIEPEVESNAITLLPPELVDRVRELHLSPAKVNRYGADRVRWVLDALDAERARKVIGNPAGWVTQALKDNWALPPAVSQLGIPFASAAAAAIRPPDDTRWAREVGTGIVLEVIDVNETRVQLAGGSVIPSHHWAEWEWLMEAVADPIVDQVGATSETDEATELRLQLARVAAWVAAVKPTPAMLRDKLTARGLTGEAWEAYQIYLPSAGRRE